jgi:hypothetical protein
MMINEKVETLYNAVLVPETFFQNTPVALFSDGKVKFPAFW